MDALAYYATIALAEWAAKATLVLLAAMGLAAALRRRSAAARHMVWAFALLGVIAIPPLSAIAPRYTVPLVPAPPELEPLLGSSTTFAALVHDATADSDAPRVTDPVDAALLAAPRQTATRPTWAERGALAALALWLAGSCVVGLRLARGIGRLRGIARRARDVDDESAQRQLAHARRTLNVKRPVRLAESSEIGTPIAVGWLRPAVLLPTALRSAGTPGLRNVLLHELAHVARNDCLTAWVAHAASTLHWFNPLLWIAARRFRMEREHACDDLVLRAGTAPCDYAAGLLALARSLRCRHVPSAALAMAARGSLEARVVAILSEARCRSGPRRGTAASSALAALLIAGLLAGLRPWSAPRTTLDPQNPSHNRSSEMKRSWISGLLASALVSGGAFAQEAQTAQDARQENQQTDERPRVQRGERGAWIERIAARIADELELDDQQREQLNQIMARQREQMRSLRGQRPSPPPGSPPQDGEPVAPPPPPLDRPGTPEMRGGFGGPNPFDQVFEELKPILREDQLERLGPIQERFSRMRGPGGPGGPDRDPMGRMLRDLPERLNLNDEQKAHFDELLDEFRAQQRERFESMRPIIEELRQAQEDGNDARVEELRAALDESRPDPGAGIDELLTKLEDALDAQQKAALADYRTELRERAPGQRDAGASDLRSLLSAVRRLDLEAEQREAVRKIERDTMAAARKLARDDREGRALLLATARKALAEVLSEEQMTKVDELMKERQRRDDRPQRRPSREPDADNP